jgi:hypothetical protein
MKGTDNPATPTHGLYAIECRHGVLDHATNRAASTATVQQSWAERREYPRTGAVRTVEDITYRVLRRYEVIAEAA